MLHKKIMENKFQETNCNGDKKIQNKRVYIFIDHVFVSNFPNFWGCVIFYPSGQSGPLGALDFLGIG